MMRFGLTPKADQPKARINDESRQPSTGIIIIISYNYHI